MKPDNNTLTLLSPPKETTGKRTFSHTQQLVGAIMALTYLWQEGNRQIHPSREWSFDVRATSLSWYVTIYWWSKYTRGGGPDFVLDPVQDELTFKLSRDADIVALSAEIDHHMELIPTGAPEL